MHSKTVSKFCLARLSRYDSASAKCSLPVRMESARFPEPMISTVAANAQCRLYDSLTLR